MKNIGINVENPSKEDLWRYFRKSFGQFCGFGGITAVKCWNKIRSENELLEDIPLIYVNRRTFRQQMKAKLSSKQLQTQRNQKHRHIFFECR
ncbi:MULTISPECIES: hypothetical protein [Chryseobacterium]|uniref:Uncharacterized protein n=1 Tax=Chryseobacterium bernardetii TaxID=1241978 RepID=A0A3G6TZQ4_9FLAO|nr:MULTISPECIES: hypothetical protein [Chryseobacterium]AZB27082.1 hypothetical protein EG339_22085 [Chryseobacterium bernardetii]AZB33487.1 hypothetical protein EG351_07575 [Chryseobacterium bernardetii]UCA61301.1 hypothetical protein KB553_07150 [Chryseobacterium rhizoplanae]